MRSTLSEAVARCQLRRLRRVAGAAPLPVAGIALVVALAPVALYRAGQALGAELAGAIDGAGVSDGIALGPLLAAMVAGAVLAVSLPGRAALGAQIAAGPPGRFASILAITVVPAIGGALVVLPSLVALCVGLARELPGGAAAGLALAAAIVAAVPVGAIVAEAGIAAARAQPTQGRRDPGVDGGLGGDRLGARRTAARAAGSRAGRTPWGEVRLARARRLPHRSRPCRHRLGGAGRDAAGCATKAREPTLAACLALAGFRSRSGSVFS